jgi:hypothetical protein
MVACTSAPFLPAVTGTGLDARPVGRVYALFEHVAPRCVPGRSPSRNRLPSLVRPSSSSIMERVARGLLSRTSRQPRGALGAKRLSAAGLASSVAGGRHRRAMGVRTGLLRNSAVRRLTPEFRSRLRSSAVERCREIGPSSVLRHSAISDRPTDLADWTLNVSSARTSFPGFRWQTPTLGQGGARWRSTRSARRRSGKRNATSF